MNQSQSISKQPPELKSQDFDFLRQQGLNVIQELAANTWTDHNLHDPGITILEAICYAFTETGLRAGMDAKDLISSSGEFKKASFFTAAEVLPTAPVNLSDFRKILINHSTVSNAWIFPLANSPLGRFNVLLEFNNDELNTNNFVLAFDIPPISEPYTVEVAFPHWSDPEIAPFREDVLIQTINFNGTAGNEWNNIIGGHSYYARAEITYLDPNGVLQVMELWIVANIITLMNDPLLDSPGILQELQSEVETIGDNSPSDQSLIKQLNRRVVFAHENMREIRRYLMPYRNMCEDIREFNAVRLQEISISALLEVGSKVNIEELLAEIYYRIYRMISPKIQLDSLSDQLDLIGTADGIFDGPVTDSGFLSENSLGKHQIMETIYASDILRIIYQTRNLGNSDVTQRENLANRTIIALRSLTLSNFLNNRPITSGARDCLHLVKSKNHVPRFSVTKSRITIFRNGLKVPYDSNLVLELFEEKLSFNGQKALRTDLDLPVPQGEIFPLNDFYPIQCDLPKTYGVGEAGLPENASPLRKSQAKQLKGYLFLFEQMLAGCQAQLSNFNTFFSSDADVDRSLFQKGLYNIPEISPLIKGFDESTISWQEFQGDKNNPYERILHDAIETEEQFLVQRNAVLDHLLATQGEEMTHRSDYLFQLASNVPDSFDLSITQIQDLQQIQKIQVLKNLIQEKSDYYRDLPELNKNKGQAFGHLLQKNKNLLEIQHAGSVYDWVLNNGAGVPLLRQSESSQSLIEVERIVNQVLILATQPNNYSIILDGATRRIALRSSENSVLAESVDDYDSDILAENGLAQLAETYRQLWISTALIPLEWRMYHCLGIKFMQRRPISNPWTEFVEIFDDLDGNPVLEKRFRLWSEMGLSGVALLESVDSFSGDTEPEAFIAATHAGQLLIQYGMEESNYLVENPATDSYRFAIVLPDGNILARSLEEFTSVIDAVEGVQQTKDFIYRELSGEGLFLLENNLLYSESNSNSVFTIPNVADPYSFQLTVILPSGFARDFEIENGERIADQPVRYRNGEFRHYAELQLRRYCPANILPRILWVDRSISGSNTTGEDPSLENFEQAYFNFLNLYMTDAVDQSLLEDAKEILILIVNALYLEYYTDH
ncbi:MAG TPA: hypothetical protein VK957_04515 [Lunatimonas sp.]|nr:hypothetical protein [Lunatimonas sp.]